VCIVGEAAVRFPWLILALGACAIDSAGESRPLALAPCQLSEVAVEARCGTYEVWENRNAASGRRIPLNVVVLPALGSDRRADPLVVLQGGPGDAPSFNVPFYSRVFSGVHKSRDLVLIDLRGTGRSRALTCPELALPDPAGALDEHMLNSSALSACRARLERDADLRFYTTEHAVDDLAEVLQALGYAQVNLFGTSYGTRAAQVLMRRHPTRVRTASLKGVVPPSMANPAAHARAGEQAWQALVARCSRDPGCAGAFPSLDADFRSLLARLDRAPMVGDLPEVPDRRATRVTITRGLFAEAFRVGLYSPEGLAGAPATVARLVRADGRTLANSVIGWRLAFGGERLAAGFFLSVTCTEDIPFLPGDWTPLVAGTFGGDYRLREQVDACKVWPRGTVSAGHREPLRSNVPTLLLSGELDPVTPPAGADEVLRGLSRGRHVVVRNNGHPIGTAAACTGRMIAAFVERGSADDLDISCASEIARIPYKLALP
jgi:pimeloyl-ACP methyl ester carboxylesterase